MSLSACLLRVVRRLSTTLDAATGPMALSPRAGNCSIYLREELPADRDPRAIIAAFRSTVNMGPEEVDRWLGTDESRLAVEQVEEDADKEGRHAARRVVELLRKDDTMYYEGDLTHMHQITQYVRCHQGLLQQRAQQGMDAEQLRGSVQRYHLMNFGFDPLKEMQAPGSSAAAGGEPTGNGVDLS